MELEPWRVMAYLTVALALFGAGVVLFDAPATVGGFVVLVVFGAAGVLLGRVLQDRFLSDD
jgi:hypothetical protein